MADPRGYRYGCPACGISEIASPLEYAVALELSRENPDHVVDCPQCGGPWICYGPTESPPRNIEEDPSGGDHDHA
jgi:hypothetical protein